MLHKPCGEILPTERLEKTVLVAPDWFLPAVCPMAIAHEFTVTYAVFNVILVAKVQSIAVKPHPPYVDFLVQAYSRGTDTRSNPKITRPLHQEIETLKA